MESTEQPLEPAAMLQLADDTERRADRAFNPDTRLMYVAWGLAYIVGSTAMWLGDRPDPIVPTALAAVIYAGSLIIAGVVTGWTIASAVRGVDGPEAEYGQRWFATFVISYVGYGLILAGLGRAFADLDGDAGGNLMNLIAPVLAVFIVGVNYLNGGSHWRASRMYPIGIALVILSGIATIVGTPNHYLVLGLGGGACFLIGAATLGSRSGATSSVAIA